MSFRSFIAVCLLTAAVPAAAQNTTTGTVAGQIVDGSGKAATDATVKLSGPAAQGVRTATTDAKGIYRFVNVLPGTGYKIEAAQKGQQASRDGVQVQLGKELTVDMTLGAASPDGTGRAMLADRTAASPSFTLTADQIQTLPTSRAIAQLVTFGPGVAPVATRLDRRFDFVPVVGASSAPEYVIDGASVTDPRFGNPGVNVAPNLVQEVQVMTAGYRAEYGRSTGGMFNIVTRSGSNTMSGDIFGYFGNKAFTPGGVLRRQSKNLTTLGDGRSDFDLGLAVGGAVKPDRLWYFLAYDPGREVTHFSGMNTGATPATTPDRQVTRVTNMYDGKITWTLSPKHEFALTVFGDPTTRRGWLLDPNAGADAALRLEKTGSSNFAGRYNVLIQPKWLGEISFGRHSQRDGWDGTTANALIVPMQTDATLGGFAQGGLFQSYQSNHAARGTYAVKFTHLLGAHELRYGIDAAIDYLDLDQHAFNYRFLGADLGFNSHVEQREYTVFGKGTTSHGALFVQDSWRWKSNVRINAGLRIENQRIVSSTGARIAIAGAADAAACASKASTCRVVEGLSLVGRIAPRVGIAWDPTKTGTTRVYASWGRFVEPVSTGLTIRALNIEKNVIAQYVSDTVLTSDTWVNPTGSPLDVNGPWTAVRTTFLNNLSPLDENLRSQYEDQFVVGLQRQIRPHWSVDARYVDRSLKRAIDDVGIFASTSDPMALTGYALANPGVGTFGAPFNKPSRHYRTVELSAERSLFHNWQMLGSFAYAKATGDHEGLYLSDFNELDPNVTPLYDTPSFQLNSDGKLRADRPYQVKVHSSYTMKSGLTVSEAFFVSSGTPISAMGPEIVNGYGNGRVFLLPRGSAGRTPTYWTFDAHAHYKLPMRVGPNRTLSVMLDVFNVFNRHTALEVDQDYVYQGMANFGAWTAAGNLDASGNPVYNAAFAASPFFKTPTLFQAPRTIQIGLRLTF